MYFQKFECGECGQVLVLVLANEQIHMWDPQSTETECSATIQSSGMVQSWKSCCHLTSPEELEISPVTDVSISLSVSPPSMLVTTSAIGAASSTSKYVSSDSCAIITDLERSIASCVCSAAQQGNEEVKFLKK